MQFQSGLKCSHCVKLTTNNVFLPGNMNNNMSIFKSYSEEQISVYVNTMQNLGVEQHCSVHLVK